MKLHRTPVVQRSPAGSLITLLDNSPPPTLPGILHQQQKFKTGTFTVQSFSSCRFQGLADFLASSAGHIKGPTVLEFYNNLWGLQEPSRNRVHRWCPAEQILELPKSLTIPSLICAGILEQSVGARNRVGIGLSYRPARLHKAGGIDSLESIPWNQFLGSLKV